MDIFGFDIPIWILLLVTVFFLAYKKSKSGQSFWTSQGVPGPSPFAFIGTFGQYLTGRPIIEVDKSLIRKYGKIVGLYTGSQPSILTSDLDFLKEAMIKKFSDMPNRRSMKQSGVLSTGMTNAKDDHWRHIRKEITPTFTTGKLKQMKPLIDVCGESFLETLKKVQDEPIQVKQVCGYFTMDVIASTAFGIHVDSHQSADSEMIRYGKAVMGDMGGKFTIGTYLRVLKFFMIFFVAPEWSLPVLARLGITLLDNDAVEYFVNLTDKIINERKSSEGNRNDFVQLTMDKLVEPKDGEPETKVDHIGNKWSEKGLTRDEIVGNAVLFFLGGFDTTSSTLQFIFFEMANYPEIQQQVYEEMKDICSTDQPSYEELGKLQLLDRCIEETMRLYPAGFRFDRVTLKPVTINGINLPADCAVSAAVFTIHHDAELWPDPEEFIPDRFTAENKVGRHPLAWVPFGIGNRNCIGMRLALLEMKIACVRTLWNFQLEKCAETPSRPITWSPKLELAPEHPIIVKATAR